MDGESFDPRLVRTSSEISFWHGAVALALFLVVIGLVMLRPAATHPEQTAGLAGLTALALGPAAWALAACPDQGLSCGGLAGSRSGWRRTTLQSALAATS